MLPADQLDSPSRTSHVAAERAETLLDHAELAVNRQLDATQQVLEDHGERLRRLWSEVDPSGTMQAGVTLAEKGAKGGVELTRAYLSTVTRLQREFAHILEWQGNATGERWREVSGKRRAGRVPSRRKAA